MNDLPVTDIHGHMIDPAAVAIEDQISRPHLLRAHVCPLLGLGAGAAVDGNACPVLHHVSGETGTVHSAVGIIASGPISSSEKLKRKIYQFLSPAAGDIRLPLDLGGRCRLAGLQLRLLHNGDPLILHGEIS